ncbi:AAA family ATPase [Pseudomonas cremoricolorata]|uniref:Nuclease SbcCD subunit C n=1 Tax=Pseudomonas cremoricolorata TaxID=157783 RepID=A0A089WQC8_9PSED|nr:AAA family ATPase [Pseudomonas cremoricolorata]AIR91510.1 chromosome segregation protein SMC [Pseudomonas cremoricolorata]
MKILAIRLKNLASLAGPVDIDFTAEPLLSAGLFAITGPTGAGKSTLLDALCLALFGSVPRLNAIAREAKVPDADGDIPTADPRNLLRRGSGSGFAEVDFIGIDGHRYRARWEANRARDKAGGKLQASRQSLCDLDAEQLLGSGKQEYKELIETRLGLNFEQFTRAVMLAQSEFSAFLKANDRDRSELLEKLTNTSIYTRLGQGAFARAREAGEAHRALQERASHLLPMASEARVELDATLDQAQQQLKAEQQRQRELEQQRAWAAELQRLQQQQHNARQALVEAQQHTESLSEQRHDVQRLDRLAPQRHQFQRQRQLLAQLQPLGEALLAQRQQQAGVQARSGELEHALHGAREHLSQRQHALDEAAPRLRQAFSAEETLARLHGELETARTAAAEAERGSAALQQQQQQVQQAQQRDQHALQQVEQALAGSAELASLGEAWQAYRGQLQQLLQIGNRLEQGTEELPALQAQLSQASAQAHAQQQDLELLYREAKVEPQAVAEQLQLLSGMLQDNRKQQRSVDEFTRLYSREQELQQNLQALAERQQQALEQRQQLIAAGTAAKAEFTAAEQALAVIQQVLERQRLARDKSVEALREQLRDGEPCSVCGSLEHPFHDAQALLASLGQHDQHEEDSAKVQVRQLGERLTTLRTELGVANAQYKDAQQQQAQLSEQWQPLDQQLRDHALWPGLDAQAESARAAWLAAQARRLEQEISHDEQRQATLTRLQHDVAQQTAQLHAAQQAQQHAQQRLEQQRSALQADQQRLEQALADFAELLPEAHLKALREAPAEAFLTLDRLLAERLQQLDQRHELQQAQQQREQQLQRLLDQQQHQSAQQQQRHTELERLDAHYQQARALLGELLGSHPSAEAWQRHLQRELEQARQGESETAQALQQAQNQALQLATELKANQAREAELTVEQQQLQEAIDQWRAEHASFDDATLERLLAVDETQLGALRQRLLAADSALQQAAVRVQERDEWVHNHQQSATEPLPAEALQQALEDVQAKLGQLEQRCAELRAQQADDQRRQQASAALAADIEQAQQQWQRWARLNALIGSASGDVFRKIAQGYNLDLLLHHANAQLRQLARRYRLKRGGSALGLLVMDTEMGDELRSVHSLSGGETFLVSLALALGLASMASSTLRIESLFIDEGFGSLDPESLQLAMDALDGLQAQGRKVAVISHVQDMHERIPVQIKVHRQGNGLSEVEVSG